MDDIHRVIAAKLHEAFLEIDVLAGADGDVHGRGNLFEQIGLAVQGIMSSSQAKLYLAKPLPRRMHELTPRCPK